MVEESRSALHEFLSVHQGREDAPFRTCLEILLKAFPLLSQLDYRDENHRTPLDIAVSHANSTAVSALLTAGATGDVLGGKGGSLTDRVKI
jgi:ankyrin repeat protein